MYRNTLYIGVDNHVGADWMDNDFWDFLAVYEVGYTVLPAFGYCDGQRERSIKVEFFTDEQFPIEYVAEAAARFFHEECVLWVCEPDIRAGCSAHG